MKNFQLYPYILGPAKYTKSEVYNAVLEKTKFRPHIDCEYIDGVQFIKVSLSSYALKKLYSFWKKNVR